MQGTIDTLSAYNMSAKTFMDYRALFILMGIMVSIYIMFLFHIWRHRNENKTIIKNSAKFAMNTMLEQRKFTVVILLIFSALLVSFFKLPVAEVVWMWVVSPVTMAFFGANYLEKKIKEKDPGQVSTNDITSGNPNVSEN